MNIKKVATIVGSALMLGATAGMAAAAAYPTPFVQNGAANVAIVYGSNAANSDVAAAGVIATDLARGVTAQTGEGLFSGATTVEGGDAYKIEGASDKWNLGENATQFRSGLLTKNDLPVVLADGIFRDKDNTDRRYTQEIQLNESLALTHFSDYDYKSEEPTVGFHLDSGSQVLEYKLNFISKPAEANIAEQEIELMGKTYYIAKVSATEQKIELLDSANKLVVVEGESASINAGGKSYQVEISSASLSGGDAEARLIVNGETLPALKKGQTRKLADGSFIGIIDVVVANRERDSHKVEVSIGTGKMTLTNGQYLRLNDKDDVRDIKAVVDYDSKDLVSLGLIWKTDKKAFLTADTSLTIPQFENLKLQVGAINFPKSEETRIEANGAERMRLVTSVKDGDYNLDLAYFNKTTGDYTGLGRDAGNKLVTTNTAALTFNESAKDRLFLVSWASASESETYIVSARLARVDSQDTVTVRNEITGEDFCKEISSGTCRVGRTDLAVSGINATTGNLVATFTASAGTFNTIYTKEGLKIVLPSTADFAAGLKEFDLTFVEENYREEIDLGTPFKVTLGSNTYSGETRADVIGTNVTTSQRQKVPNVDEYIYYVPSALATKLNYKYPSSSQNSMIITYHGAEVSADVFVSASSATISGGDSGSVPSLGAFTIKDNEVSSMSDKNLIVVGGSCVNSVAADLLGGAACGADFTAKTNIKSGEALIKSFNKNGKISLLVAGYNAEDTTKAVTYLVNKGLADTSSANLKVTSATEATAITA